MANFIVPEILANPEYRGKRVREVRDKILGLTRENFCENSDLTVPSLKAWELAWGGGLTEAGAKRFVTQAKKLGVYCTVAWLLYGIGTPATQMTNELTISELEEEQIAKEILVFRNNPMSIDAIVQDDTMIPLLYPRNYVAGTVVENLSMLNHQPAIIVDDQNNLHIRIIEPSSTANRYNLTCLNQHAYLGKKQINNIKIKQAAPILWIRRPLSSFQ